MNISIPLAVVVVLLAGGCTGQVGQGPAQSTGVPFGVNGRELETPNSLPPGFETVNPMAPETGVVGVTHQAP